MSCPHLACKNRNKLCFKCFNESYLKLDSKNKKIKKQTYKNDIAMAEDSWKDLEQQVADKLNNIPTMQEARLSRRSGALWFETGDIVDDIVHPECKERTPKDIKNGADKSLTVNKSWLTKAKKEAESVNKIMILPFRFKGEDIIYNIMEFNDIAELILHYKQLVEENNILRAELEVYKENK